MVNQYSTVTNIQDYLSNTTFSERVLVSKNNSQFVYEIYVEEYPTEEIVQEELEMMFSTYGAEISKDSTRDGQKYYRLTVSSGALIDNR